MFVNRSTPNSAAVLCHQISTDLRRRQHLILYLCGEADLDEASLAEALQILESFLIRRAVCCLTTKNYNRLFLQLVEGLRGKSDVVETLRTALLQGTGDAVVWPDDLNFKQAWLNRPLYNDLTSSRVQFILRQIELAKRTAKNEDIHIRSMLTVEHIMPRAWEKNWPMSDGTFAKNSIDRLLQNEPNVDADNRVRLVNTIGNLTLLTQPLNSSLQNGGWSEKKPEIMKQSSLAMNRELVDATSWSDAAIMERGNALYLVASAIWPR